MTGSTVLIVGNTYPVRARLRELGGVWDAAAYGWRVPACYAGEARALVENAGPAPARGGRSSRRGRSGSSYTRFSSGAEVYTNRRGRCEDAPCCGCCS